MQDRKKQDQERGRTIGYARVSTEDQAREGFSIEAQAERIRAFCLATGRTCDEIIIDAGQSAKTLRRSGLQRILADVRSGDVSTVIVLKLDRLTRSVRDLADLVELFTDTGTALVAVQESLDSSSAGGRLMLNLLASVSQWEREAIGERTATVLGHRRSKRRAYGHVAFGFRREGDRLIEHPEEQRAIKIMREMRESGKSLQSVANWLSINGFAPRQGGSRWHPQTVKDVLESKIATEVA